MESVETVEVTVSGIAHTGPCWMYDVLLGTDGVNDPTIAVYDGLDTSGEKKIPTNTYDAALLGLNGVIFNAKRRCSKGIYVEISCAGAVEVIIGRRGF